MSIRPCCWGLLPAMYHDDYESCLDSLTCNDVTTVMYYESRDASVTDERLGEKAFLDKLADVVGIRIQYLKLS